MMVLRVSFLVNHWCHCSQVQRCPPSINQENQSHDMILYQSTDSQGQRLWVWVKVLRCTRHKICHFGDVIPRQSLGLVLKKLNVMQQK